MAVNESHKPDRTSDEVMVRRITQMLDDSVEQLDTRTTMALQRARHRALYDGARSTPVQWRPLWAGGAALAVLAMATMLWWHTPGGQSVGVSEPTEHAEGLAVMDALASMEATEIVDEIEFYSWLAQVEHAG